MAKATLDRVDKHFRTLPCHGLTFPYGSQITCVTRVFGRISIATDDRSLVEISSRELRVLRIHGDPGNIVSCDRMTRIT